MFPQVRMTHAHLPLLLHLLRKNLQCVHFEGHERGLLPVCVVCVYRSTLRRSTRKWVRKPPAAGLRAVEGGGRLLFDMWHQKKNFHYFITFFFIFFFTAGYFPTWKQYQGCGFIHLFLHNRCVVFTLQYPIFIHL